MEPTRRLYLETPALQCNAAVQAIRGAEFAIAQSPFYPGGGGQPADLGTVRDNDDGQTFAVTGVRQEEGVVWHTAAASLPDQWLGRTVLVQVDGARRAALSRYHTVLHVLNTLTLRDHGGWITGAQIAPDYARIDFKLERLSAELCADLAGKVNAVIAADHPVTAHTLDAETFARRNDLLRTLEARPPVVEGRVRIVRIAGFDEQACGGTHVARTGQIGAFAIERTENKGRINKRLYVRLATSP